MEKNPSNNLNQLRQIVKMSHKSNQVNGVDLDSIAILDLDVN